MVWLLCTRIGQGTTRPFHDWRVRGQAPAQHPCPPARLLYKVKTPRAREPCSHFLPLALIGAAFAVAIRLLRQGLFRFESRLLDSGTVANFNFV